MAARVVAILVMAIAVAWTYQPVVSFAFLNWDDEAVILRNAVARLSRRRAVGIHHDLHGALPAPQLAGVGGDQDRVRPRPGAVSRGKRGGACRLRAAGLGRLPPGAVARAAPDDRALARDGRGRSRPYCSASTP